MHVMIDLETAATTPNADLLTVGAIRFDPTTEEIDNDIFYVRVQTGQGRYRDPDTLRWWSQQSLLAQAEVFESEPSCAIEQMLKDLTGWLGDKPVVWSQGSCFDIVILEDAFRQFDLKVPWDYWDIRDTRTIYYAAAGRFEQFVPDDASAHVAWKDAYAQCVSVHRAMKALR